MSVQRRPRISDELAADIDAARGREPFESYVRNAIAEYLHFFHKPHSGLRDTMTYEGALLALIACSDVFQLDLKAFDVAVAEARAYVVAELDRQAVEDEHDDTA